MPLAISFELSDRDLEHFKAAIDAAHKSAGDKTADEITSAAGKLLEEASKVQLPDFIAQRLDNLDAMIAMVRDEGWALEESDRQRVLSALVYFSDPADIIPDSVPVLGYFDDAIAIELCVKELRHELEAYEEFCEYRENEAQRRGMNAATVGRADWLSNRRSELQERMHKRRDRDYGTGYGSSSGYGREGYSRPWRPGLLRVR
jgi:uncharacterized membrane protein YkvA (DUF1232 family)